MKTHVEHATNDHACLAHTGYFFGSEFVVLNRVTIEGSNARKISDEEWETLVTLVAELLSEWFAEQDS